MYAFYNSFFLLFISTGSQELIYKVQKYHLNRTSSEPVSLLAGTLLMSRWSQLVEGAALSSWRHTLATILTHADAENMPHYCGQFYYNILKVCDIQTNKHDKILRVPFLSLGYGTLNHGISNGRLSLI